jgi:hypothetical protein
VVANHVVHNELRLMAVEVGKLETLVVHKQKHALLRSEKRVEAGIGGLGIIRMVFSGFTNNESGATGPRSSKRAHS